MVQAGGSHITDVASDEPATGRTATRAEILQQVQDAVRRVLDHPDVVLSDTTVVDEVDDWDSITHVQIIVAVEAHFCVRFAEDEFLEFANIGEMVDSILAKLQGASRNAE